MLQIHCPYCDQTRTEEEFHCKGEAHIVRPVDPESISDEDWGRYLFHRKNIKGAHREMWYHSAGCRKVFNVIRNTVTYEIICEYKLDESAPSGAEEVRG